ncbi:MAG: hypothetical protein Q7R22_014940, partial [Verrucomicrobiota bacterium JB025]|nr:hypothetical protein [Verrucomicrobiota bacterium JB025]
DSCNDIPLEGSQSLDISDIHTRSRPSRQGDVTSILAKNRHALATKNHKFVPEEYRIEGSRSARLNEPPLQCWSFERLGGQCPPTLMAGCQQARCDHDAHVIKRLPIDASHPLSL